MIPTTVLNSVRESLEGSNNDNRENQPQHDGQTSAKKSAKSRKNQAEQYKDDQKVHDAVPMTLGTLRGLFGWALGLFQKRIQKFEKIVDLEMRQFVPVGRRRYLRCQLVHATLHHRLFDNGETFRCHGQKHDVYSAMVSNNHHNTVSEPRSE
jgi:hypothetical protein